MPAPPMPPPKTSEQEVPRGARPPPEPAEPPRSREVLRRREKASIQGGDRIGTAGTQENTRIRRKRRRRKIRREEERGTKGTGGRRRILSGQAIGGWIRSTSGCPDPHVRVWNGGREERIWPLSSNNGRRRGCKPRGGLPRGIRGWLWRAAYAGRDQGESAATTKAQPSSGLRLVRRNSAQTRAPRVSAGLPRPCIARRRPRYPGCAGHWNRVTAARSVGLRKGGGVEQRGVEEKCTEVFSSQARGECTFVTRVRLENATCKR